MTLRLPSPHLRGKFYGIFVVALLAASPVAWAHPGHAWSDAGAAHLVTSPDHAAGLAFLGIAAGLFSQLIRARGVRVMVRGLGAAALLSAAVLWTWAV